ncbi:unnamed protein product [Rhizoctonia solani]|uniref:Uncharacterized protein n=1 Tax=Rhizoctonia solani TaxID=456999 RepID=A0A8H3AXG8_9AGAM|nr:unnamed protein product [Rhizoctonia solani]
MADLFEHFTGKVIVHALFTAEDGHADELAKALKAIQVYAQSDKEAGRSSIECSIRTLNIDFVCNNRLPYVPCESQREPILHI